MDGETLAAVRQMAGLSQKALATDLGVTVKTVNNWENGRNKMPAGTSAVLEGRFAEQLLTVAQGREGYAPLAAATDLELLSEVARRFARSARRSGEDGDGNGRRDSTTTTRQAGEFPTLEEVVEARRLHAVAQDGDPEHADLVDEMARQHREEHESQE